MVGLSSTMITVIGAGGVLAVTVLAGILTHESAHAAVLHAFGIRYDVSWLPDRPAAGPHAALANPVMTVTPRPGSQRPNQRAIRLAAIAPLGLAAPLTLVVTGVFPDPFAAGDPYLAAAFVGWVACALPSPQDFAMFWHGFAPPE